MGKGFTKSFCRLSQQSPACRGLPSSSRFSGQSRISGFPLGDSLSLLRAPRQLPWWQKEVEVHHTTRSCFATPSALLWEPERLSFFLSGSGSGSLSGFLFLSGYLCDFFSGSLCISLTLSSSLALSFWLSMYLSDSLSLALFLALMMMMMMMMMVMMKG